MTTSPAPQPADGEREADRWVMTAYWSVKQASWSITLPAVRVCEVTR